MTTPQTDELMRVIERQNELLKAWCNHCAHQERRIAALDEALRFQSETEAPEPQDRDAPDHGYLMLDELIAWLVDLRKSSEEGRLPIVLEPDAWTIHDCVEIGDIEREPSRFMIKWGH